MKIIERKMTIEDWQFNIAMFFIVGLMLGLAFGSSDKEYTQSEVSALMKFNAGEFDCIDSIYFDKVETKDGNVLKANCLDSDKVLKQLIYFPQFDGVKIELEPERQECTNDTEHITYNIRNNINNFYENATKKPTCTDGFKQMSKWWLNCQTSYGDKEMYCTVGKPNVLQYVTNEQYNYIVNENHICANITTITSCPNKLNSNGECWVNKQSCQTVPAVTKQINPWAVSENDLATEFCRMKTYRFDHMKDCFDELNLCFDGRNKREAKICENWVLYNSSECNWKGKDSIEVKSFTRGEVIAAGCPVKKELSCSQKHIRCHGEDGTQRDFDVFGGKNG